MHFDYDYYGYYDKKRVISSVLIFNFCLYAGLKIVE